MRAEKAGVGTSEPLTDVIWRNVQSGWSFAFDHPSVRSIYQCGGGCKVSVQLVHLGAL